MIFTVLVVDDEKNIRAGAERVLRNGGFRVLTAESGERGLEILEEEPVHIMLLDLMMPGIGGMEVLEKVSASHPNVLVIVITGYATLETAVQAMKQGAYDFVPKPFQPDQLRIVVFRAADTLRLREEHRRLAEERQKTLKDIDREKSRTRTIIECMTEGVLVTDCDGEVVLCNERAAGMLGLKGPPAPGRPVHEYISDEGLRDLILDTCTDSNCSGAALGTQEVETGDGRWLLGKVTPVVTAGAEVAGALTVLSDITTMKELDRLRTEFVAKVSHELRSPLASINQQLAVVLLDLFGEEKSEQRERLSRVKERAKGLLGMISDLLDISRIEQGEGGAQREPVVIAEAIAHAVDVVAPRAEEKGLTLKSVAPEAGEVIEADQRELESVFVNLLTNAINYTPPGGHVSIVGRVEGDELVVDVTDDGIGISEQDQARVFEKFFRVKSAEARRVVGSGLGLPIVTGIVASYGGTLGVSSEPGKGSTFTVTLPCSAPGASSVGE